MIRGLILALLIALPVSALAEGKFRYSLQSQHYFMTVEFYESNGVREGVMNYGGGQVPLRSYIEDNKFIMEYGGASDILEIFPSEKSMWMRGRLWNSGFSYFDLWHVQKNHGIRFEGHVSEQFDVKFESNGDKKNFYMEWQERESSTNPDKFRPVFFLDVKADPKTAGACKGRLLAQYESNGLPVIEEVGKFYCSSSGSLEDAFFKSYHDVMAYLLRLQIIPDRLR